jgi:hypothetical protein
MIDVADSTIKFSALMFHVLCAVVPVTFLTNFKVVANCLQMVLETFRILESASTIFTFNVNAKFSLACAILNAPTMETFRLKYYYHI